MKLSTRILIVLCLLQIVDSRRKYCHPPSIDDRTKLKGYVFTGTVVRTVKTGTSNEYYAAVKLKRMISDTDQSLVLPASDVIVSGLGNDRFCESDVRAGDTRIFFATKKRDRFYVISASVARITIRNLRRVEASLTGRFYFNLCIYRLIHY